MSYDHKILESKWQKYWEENKTFRAHDNSEKEKFYALDMFPYPSGAGLHVGHPKGYTATDIISRKKRMEGYEVLHPMGWDAFGLPAENYAIKTGVHPKASTLKNIETFTRQIKSLGFSYDWEREINSCLPNYYKWTQWTFLFLYKQGLAYKKKAPVNWCGDCMTVLANEQVVDGKCERCKHLVIQKNLAQWFFKVTDFIEDQDKTSGLINGLDKIDWPQSTKTNQKNWIGKSEGAEIDFEVEKSDKIITVFTTRADTLYSAAFMVLAPEHELVRTITTPEYETAVEKYVMEASHKTELDRTDLGKEKTGIFTGSYAINPIDGSRIPIWIADFVLVNYGTGAVFGDAHDERDFEFAQKYDIPLKISIRPENEKEWKKVKNYEVCFSDYGILVNSDRFDGMTSEEAKIEIASHLEAQGKGKRKTNYRLRDWLVSRQRYWGAPIPIVYDPEGNPHPIPEEHLPWELPTDVDYKPKGTSPLGSSQEFFERTEKIFGKGWTPEIDTMDTFVCSSWYYFRFVDPNNKNKFASEDALKNWLPVDLYVGGAEHTVLHLLYSRFYTKAFHRAGLIDFDEPFLKLRHQGMILAEDGRKMSKSLGNVVNPDEIVEAFGADTLRVYEMFMGPFEQAISWDSKAVNGVNKFLNRIWRLFEKPFDEIREDGTCETGMRKDVRSLIHKTIKKVTEDIEEFKFNTAISQLMIFTNEAQKWEPLPKKTMEKFIKILSPFAPHLAEEIWHKFLGHDDSIAYAAWPTYNEKFLVEDEVTYAVQVNGKLRADFTMAKDTPKDEVIAHAKTIDRVKKYLEEGEIKKEIFVPGKIVGFVVK